MERDHDPDVETLQKIAQALNVPVSSFFGSDRSLRLDADKRRKLELSLQDLVREMPTISKREMLDRMMALIAELSHA